MARGTAGATGRGRSRAVLLGVAASMAVVLGTSLWAYAETRSGAEPADYVTDASQEEEEETVSPTTEIDDPALRGTEVRIPQGWAPAGESAVHHDTAEVIVRRYQADGERTLGGSHLSVVEGEGGRLVGLTRLDAAAAGDPGDLPGHEQAREVAYTWLARQDPEYLEGLTEQWVDRHDEVVVDADGQETVVPGIKVKTRHEDGRYAWVIVGVGSQVVTFERDITWDSAEQRRSTQMWLHDAWVAAVEGTGEQPPAPAAVADADRP
ncbi:hypothetical protein [Nocardiopsis valliformis]|uniref:hypothetical protein n=1 Tax=Nocardiopsis valliformis TaxID=239974 RepID=UPI00187320B6|nr:hypothetical protein [Nocardiopsis valliformis]